MLSLEKCRAILGERFKNLPDKVIFELRDYLTQLAKTDIEIGLQLKPNNKHEESSFDDEGEHRRAS